MHRLRLGAFVVTQLSTVLWLGPRLIHRVLSRERKSPTNWPAPNWTEWLHSLVTLFEEQSVGVDSIFGLCNFFRVVLWLRMRKILLSRRRKSPSVIRTRYLFLQRQLRWLLNHGRLPDSLVWELCAWPETSFWVFVARNAISDCHVTLPVRHRRSHGFESRIRHLNLCRRYNCLHCPV